MWRRALRKDDTRMATRQDAPAGPTARQIFPTTFWEIHLPQLEPLLDGWKAALDAKMEGEKEGIGRSTRNGWRRPGSPSRSTRR